MIDRERLKISELAERAGVEKSTIQHYIREGLLPVPEERPHRNMHYYSPDLVERIKLIKEMQQRGNLPLSKIRQILADEQVVDSDGIDAIRAMLYAAPAPFEPAAGKLPRARLVEDTGIEPEVLDRLEEHGFVTPARKGTAVTYDAIDVAIVHAVQSMRRAGLDAPNGFRLEEMVFYIDAMRDLMRKELALFARVLRDRPTGAIVEMARRGFEGTNTLLVNLRRKLFLELLADLDQARTRRRKER